MKTKKKLLCILITPLLFLLPLHAALAETTLTLVNFWPPIDQLNMRAALSISMGQRYRQALAAFQDAHPDVTIDHRAAYVYPDLTEALLAGEAGIDLIAAYNIDLAEYQRKGVLLDLSKEAAIMEKLERYPSLQMFTEGGALVAIPYQMRFARLRVLSVITLEKLDITAPTEGWTWDDLFKLGEKVAAYNQTNGTEYKLLAEGAFPYCIEQYLCNVVSRQDAPATVDTPALRALLTGYKYLVDNNLIMLGNWRGVGPTPVFELVYMSPVSITYTVPTPVYEEGIKDTIATTSYYMISANSQQKELAVEFLSYLIDPDITPHGALYQEYSHNGVFLEGSYPNHSAEQVAQWLAPYEQSIRHTSTVTTTLASILVREYLAGGISQDVCVNLLEAYLKAVTTP